MAEIENNGTTPSIRDSVENAIETVITESTVASPEIKADVEKTKAERARDDAGRFAKEAADAKLKAEASEKEKTEKTPATTLQRPSSWKKDYWPHWDKLTTGQPPTPEEALALATYIAQREQDYAKGVSTYKAEWDNAKPLIDAIQPITPILKQMGIDPGRWLNDITGTYKALVGGDAQTKLRTLFQVAAQFQVPLEAIFEQDENGRMYLNPQKLQGLQSSNIQSPHPQHPQQDVRQVVKELMIEQEATQQVASFTKQHPHLDQVRETMAGLLRAGLVEDLNSAYEAALRMPQHKELFDSITAAQQEKEETRQREEATKAAQAARVKAVSPRSSTPVGQVKTAKDNGIRSTIEEAFNQRSGRV